MSQPTKRDLVEDLIVTNRRTDGETVTMKQHEKHGEYNPWQAVTRFGSWYEAKTSAGVYRPPSKVRREVSNQELKDDVQRVRNEVEDFTVQDYREKGNYSASLIYRRFDSINDL